ncbi:MAG: histidine phosphatase family protein [Hydrogenoanaerobacterium sp.]
MITYKIYFIRHGMTGANLKGLYVGRTNTPLCDDGREQLDLLKENCGYPEIQKLYCSPLIRCRETAEILYPDTSTQIINDLVECDFGAFDGKSMDELKNEPAFISWTNSGMKTPPPGGESGAELEERVCNALNEILDDMMKNKLQAVGVVTHGGVIMTLMARYALPQRESPYDWITENGTGYTVQFTPQMWMRDEAFEYYEKIPYRVEMFNKLGVEKYREQLREWEERAVEGTIDDEEYSSEDLSNKQ